MIFSSIAFLFQFLPLVLIGYFIVRRIRWLGNAFLTAASLVFYAYGEPTFVFIMVFAIILNWLFGLWIARLKERKKSAKGVVALAVTFNLGLLSAYKYLAFILTSLNQAFSLQLPVPEISLPIGISFFTFQAISYVVDVYRGDGTVQKNLMNVCLYISFFPQLIAGPIVRYQTVADEIINRKETLDDFSAGAHRFMVGLCKKVILADNLGLLVNSAFALKSQQLSVFSAWMAAVAYLLQVYYDFGGYSDMAIGLGRMFGFHFPENFRFPFLSKSVAEFWRRWHISLGSWFQDYLYYPLGGSRVKSVWRLLFNMFVVWSLTGLWHGAAWTYFLWGCGFFVMLAFERLTGLGKWMEKHPVGHLYAMFIVVTITVMIRSSNLSVAWTFYGTMFGVNGAQGFDALSRVFLREYGVFLAAGILCSFPVGDFLKKRIHITESALQIAGAVALAALTVIALGSVAAGGYNPFIYANF